MNTPVRPPLEEPNDSSKRRSWQPSGKPVRLEQLPPHSVNVPKRAGLNAPVLHRLAMILGLAVVIFAFVYLEQSFSATWERGS